MNSTVINRASLPAAALLSTWNDHEWRDGVSIDQLAAFDRITVKTHYSTYEFVVLSPGDGGVLVRGGEFFPEFTRARLAGSTLGGSFLKLRSIHPGFKIEISLGLRYVLTSPVRSISIARPSSSREVM